MFSFRQDLSTAADSEFSIADFNGDGKLDVAISYFLYPLDNRPVPIRLLAGDGAGGFTDITAATFPGGAPTTVFGRENVLADFNGDGRADVFFAGHGYDAPPFPGEHNALMLSSGATGDLNASDRLPNLNSNFSHSAEGGDIDGDGDIDIYVGNGGSPAPYFLINDGHGNFTKDSSGLPTPIATGQIVADSEAFLDVDRDGDLDLFLGTAGAGHNPNQLLINDGHGHFTLAPVNPPMPTTPQPIGETQNVDAKSFDVNGDGLPDIVSSFTLYAPAGDAPRYVQVLINHGDNTFTDETAQRLPANLVTGTWITRLNIVDFNGDGYLDIVASNHEAAPIYLNNGYGQFIQMPSSVGTFGEFTSRFPADFNGDGRMDLLVWQGNFNGAEHFHVDFAVDRGLTQTGTAAADGFMGDGDAETMSGGDGNDVIFGGGGNDDLRGDGGDDQIVGGPGDDTLTGGAGNDAIVGGAGVDTAVYDATAASYSRVHNADGSWTVTDLRTGSPSGIDTLRHVEILKFSDGALAIGADLPAATDAAILNITRASSKDAGNLAFATDLSEKMLTLTPAQAVAQIVKAAGATSSVATLAYEFFTGKIPSSGGMDYLVSPTGPNANNLNSAYYQSFSLENRYINFAVNLGKAGEGAAAFTAKYGGLSLFEATRTAYATIFGEAPSDTKLHAILDPTTVLNGQTFTRSDYFAYYGLDGANGIGTKAAMVGYLLAEAEKADLGVYAKVNDAFLTDLADGATFAVDMVGVYGKPEYVFHPG